MRRAVPALALVVIVLGCAGKARPYVCLTPAVQAAPDVHAIWECNRGIMERIVRGKKFSIREFENAAEFFGRLTGIAADWNGTYVGPVPGPKLKENLQDWDAWYGGNADRLVWDADAAPAGLVAVVCGG